MLIKLFNANWKNSKGIHLRYVDFPQCFTSIIGAKLWTLSASIRVKPSKSTISCTSFDRMKYEFTGAGVLVVRRLCTACAGEREQFHL